MDLENNMYDIFIIIDQRVYEEFMCPFPKHIRKIFYIKNT